MNPSADASKGKAGLVGAAAVAALAAPRASAAEGPGELAEILDKLPADDYQTGQQLCKSLLAGGAATIGKLLELVGDEFGDPGGAKPKYALHGLASYASRDGGDADRKLLAETLAGELEADHSDELKAFIVRQLQLCGRPEEVPALAVLLGSGRLCNPACQALSAIGGDAALGALHAALPKADGPRRVAIVLAVEFLSKK